MKSCSKIPYRLRNSSQLLITMTHTGHCELWKILLKAKTNALKMRGKIPKSKPKVTDCIILKKTNILTKFIEAQIIPYT